MTLDKYTNVQINSTEQLLESNSTALADLPAHEIVFTDIGLKTMHYSRQLKMIKYTLSHMWLRERISNMTSR